MSVSLILSFAAEVISQGETKPLSAYRAQGQIRINMIKYGWMLIKQWPSVALTKRIIWKGRHYYRVSCRSAVRAKHANFCIQITHLGFIYYIITKRGWEFRFDFFFFVVVKPSSLLNWFVVLKAREVSNVIQLLGCDMTGSHYSH